MGLRFLRRTQQNFAYKRLLPLGDKHGHYVRDIFGPQHLAGIFS